MRKSSTLKKFLIWGVLVLAGALFKNKVLGAIKNVPILGTIEDKVGENASKN